VGASHCVPCAVLAAVAGCSWDNVEELSAAAAHKKVAYQDDKVASDPLEAFCDDNPDADECRWAGRGGTGCKCCAWQSYVAGPPPAQPACRQCWLGFVSHQVGACSA
jgi:hypothetical protein